MAVFPEAPLQIFPLSSDAVSTCYPSGEKTAERRKPRWPSSVRKHSPEEPLQIFTMSSDVVSTCCRSGEKTAER